MRGTASTHVVGIESMNCQLIPLPLDRPPVQRSLPEKRLSTAPGTHYVVLHAAGAPAHASTPPAHPIRFPGCICAVIRATLNSYRRHRRRLCPNWPPTTFPAAPPALQHHQHLHNNHQHVFTGRFAQLRIALAAGVVVTTVAGAPPHKGPPPPPQQPHSLIRATNTSSKTPSVHVSGDLCNRKPFPSLSPSSPPQPSHRRMTTPSPPSPLPRSPFNTTNTSIITTSTYLPGDSRNCESLWLLALSSPPSLAHHRIKAPPHHLHRSTTHSSTPPTPRPRPPAYIYQAIPATANRFGRWRRRHRPSLPTAGFAQLRIESI
ncbi:hypothetical protein FPV67DRAFT_1669494 [Lyophyllum atratum]|nr:hypothetical protein FPV67DRAFT_1669494 [Lyophyllum atratum]